MSKICRKFISYNHWWDAVMIFFICAQIPFRHLFPIVYTCPNTNIYPEPLESQKFLLIITHQEGECCVQFPEKLENVEHIANKWMKPVQLIEVRVSFYWKLCLRKRDQELLIKEPLYIIVLLNKLIFNLISAIMVQIF